MPPAPAISAIVLNYKTPQDTVRCVRALLNQTVAKRVTPSGVEGSIRDSKRVWFDSAHHDTFGLEILIVDNHSVDDSIGVIRATFGRHPSRVSPFETPRSGVAPQGDTLAHVRILETRKNIGYGQGNMTASAQAQGDYILIINPDNELEPDGLEKMLAAMERDPDIGILGPKLVHQDGTIRDSFRSFPTLIDLLIKRTFLRHIFKARMRRYLQYDADRTQMRDVNWLAGACLLIRRSLFSELGGFDSRFFLFFEDTDLCRKCWQSGKRVVYFPEASATDRKHRLSEGGFWTIFTKKTVRIHLASAMRYFWKWRKNVAG